MNRDFFKTTKILDGGMGQWLLTRGLTPVRTLWGASAFLEKKHHRLVVEAHQDFMNAGADVIITNSFTTRRQRLIENGLENSFETFNTLAGELAQKAKKHFPHVMVGGCLPPQQNTYEPDLRCFDRITHDFYDQAQLLNPYVDFFYFDVLSSFKECECALHAIESFNKPCLFGIHISKGSSLPSNDSLSSFSKLVKHSLSLGAILACVSPEVMNENIEALKGLEAPFGFKINAFQTTCPNEGYTKKFKACMSGNPKDVLGKRSDITPSRLLDIAKTFRESGATIFGGCCETTPDHSRALAAIKVA
jgi:homocysteine S-methyltransferase